MSIKHRSNERTRAQKGRLIFVNDAIKWVKVSFKKKKKNWSDWESILYSYEGLLAGSWMLVLPMFAEFCKLDASDN